MTLEAAPTGHLAELLRLVEERAGLVLRSTRWAEFEVIVAELVVRSGARTGWDYVESVRAQPATFDALLVRLVIGETYFFREANQIRELRERIIPALGARKSGILRVWSAGCASGEEAYSLSILFQELGFGDRTEVVGTDVSPRAVETATEGVYRPWSFRGVEPDVIARYFRTDGERFRIEGEVKRRVRFARHNLATDAYPPALLGQVGADLILCRNVLFYFTRERARDIGSRLMSCLTPGGILVTGPSDPMLRCDPPIEALVTPGGLFYRRVVDGGASEALRVPSPAATGFVLDGFDSGTGTSLASNDVVRPPPPVEPSFQPRPRRITDRPIPHDGARVEEAFRAGDYERAAELAALCADSPAGAVLLVRSLANARGTQAAVEECETLLERHRLDLELTFLHATLLLDLGRTGEAFGAARQVVYLDRSSEMGHFLMGTIAMRRGDLPVAERALRHVQRLAGARPPDEPVRLGDGLLAGALAETANEWLGRCRARSS